MKLMVIAPHCDDAELGCGGYMARASEENGEVMVVVATVSAVQSIALGRVVAAEERLSEWRCAAEKLGVAYQEVLFTGYDGRMHEVGMDRVVSKLDGLMQSFEPDTVLLPLPSSHQDHRYVYEASIASCRFKPTQHKPSLIAAYEYPASSWGDGADANASKGGMYVDITRQVEKKKAALDCFVTQMHDRHDHLISVTGSLALSRLRGVESGFEHAELFHVLRYRMP